MTSVPLEEAQARLTEIVHQLGNGEEVTVVEDGKVVARLVGERQVLFQRPGPGLLKGMMTIVSDDDEHLKDFAGYM